jgi:hypothetical protein
MPCSGRAANSERFALIATYRTDDLDRAHPLRPYLVELRRDARVQSIDLEPFSRAEFADHVAAILGTLPSPASLDRLYERSEGNAFFTEALLTTAGSGELPVSLRDTMAVHLERLPPAAERVVRVLAAAGRRVDHRLLERAAAVPADELSAALRAALDARVIVPAATGAPMSSGMRCYVRPLTRTCCRASGRRCTPCWRASWRRIPSSGARRSRVSSPTTGMLPASRSAR